MNRSNFLKGLLAPIVVFLSITVYAQVCDGSLGDPVVNITFDDGPAGPSSFVPSSSYAYQSSDCPNDGYYTIVGASSSCFGSTWHTLAKDHSGTGRFMLVNASFDPGDFFVTTVQDLCPNTTYEFSAWVLNIMMPFNSIRPNLVFSIETPAGTRLATYNTNDVPVTTAPEWKKYGILFSTPPDNATIVLRITNNAPGGYGNDLALDDIGFRPCGGKVTAGIENSEDSVDLCEGNTAAFTFTGSADGMYQQPVYQWQSSTDEGKNWQNIAGATDTVYQRGPTPQPANYWYRLKVTDAAFAANVACGIASSPLIINVHPLPVADAGPDRVYINGYPVTINASVSGESVTWYWDPVIYMVNDSTLNPVVTPPVNTIYTLHVRTAFDCSAADRVYVEAVGGIFIPTAFTPNKDGLNDRWNIPYLDVGFEADVKVFNRWGRIVYHVQAAVVSWDGTLSGLPQPAGSYIYVITFKNKTLPALKGTIMLIR